MPDINPSTPRGLAVRFEGPLQRIGGWMVLAVGLGGAVAGAVAAVMIPTVTMAPLPKPNELPRLSGTIVDVSGTTPGIEAKGVSRHSSARLKLKPVGGDPVWLSLGTGFFVARDLERRCGLGDHNLDSIIGRSADVAHDGALQVVELRIGRVLCVKAASADRESAISAELRKRGLVYAPILLLGGGLMAGLASLMLGLWDKR